jgi:hypothetical protein
MNRNFLISAVFILVLCTTALGYEGQDIFGEYYIPVGDPCIDGVISPGEWDHANWLDLDQVYYGDARDLSDAKWAAMWSPETNRIYVVVQGRDTEQIFGDEFGELGWNKYDQVEVYIDANDSDMDPYSGVWDVETGDEIGMDYAQQWMTGNDNNDGCWCVLPQEPVYLDPPLPEEYRPEMATTIDGNLLTYEYAVLPFKSFGWLSGRETVELQLEADLEVGLDVVMSSKSTTFGMLCENAWRGTEDFDEDGEPDGIITEDKWNFASRFLDHWLVLDVNQAWRPRPAHKSENMPTVVTLQWNAGRNAGAHDVYLGTSFEDVDDATDPNLGPVGKGRQALGNKTYTADELNLNTTYYWRIDEVNGPAKWKGNIWRFRTGDYIVVEDFDSYATDEEIVGDGGSIEPVWTDYWSNDTSAELFLETEIVRDGNSLRYYYGNDDSPYYSESKANIVDLAADANWAAYDIKALSLWFYGDPDNSTTVNDGMYLALEDTGGNLAVVPYDGDADDLKFETWQEWNIALADFNEANKVDLSSIASIYIGFGDRYAPAGDRYAPAGVGNGTVYFDDIRLYLSRCIPAHAEGDATGDCIANFDDFIIMAGDWLESEFTVDISEPTGELIWYMFDNDGTNSTAVDSSGNGYDGTVTDADWMTEGHIDGALNFDGITTQVDVPLAALTSITTKVTIALWQYGNPAIQPKADCLFEGTRIGEPNGIRVLNVHLPYSDERVVWCAGNPNDVYDVNVWDDCERIEKVAVPKEYEGRWNHWTFIKDCDANSGAGELKMYLNGLLWHIGYDVSVPLTGTIDNEFLIGTGWDGFYAGVIDDFRIYDKVLTQEEISWLATKGTGYYPLQDREANFDEDGESAEKIDLMDFAVMADYWFEEQVWP